MRLTFPLRPFSRALLSLTSAGAPLLLPAIGLAVLLPLAGCETVREATDTVRQTTGMIRQATGEVRATAGEVRAAAGEARAATAEAQAAAAEAQAAADDTGAALGATRGGGAPGGDVATGAATVPPGCALNDRPACATELPVGYRARGLTGRGRPKYYTLALSNPGPVRFTLDPAPARCAVTVRVLDAGNGEVATWTFPAGSPGAFDVEFYQAGRYAVEVNHSEGRGEAEPFALAVTTR